MRNLASVFLYRCRGTFQAGSGLLGGGEHPPDTFLATPGFSKVLHGCYDAGCFTQAYWIFGLLHLPGITCCEPRGVPRVALSSASVVRLLPCCATGPGLHQRLQPGLVLAGAWPAADGLHPR